MTPAHAPSPKLPVRIGRIDYVNVAPIYYGLDQRGTPDWLEIRPASPADLNARMAAGDLDAGPVSTGALVENSPNWLVMPDLSIACDGAVKSVLLVSRFPFKALHQRSVLVSDESGTAVLLLRLLFAMHGIRPDFQPARIDHRTGENDTTAAALIIGDKALYYDWSHQFRKVWDLGELWWTATGLPFVFAVWVVRKGFAERYPQWVARIWRLFIASRRSGYENRERIVRWAADELGITQEVSRHYFNHLHYNLDAAKQKSLTAFFDLLNRHAVIDRQVKPLFWKDPGEITPEAL
jgi:chorismate dehydratase